MSDFTSGFWTFYVGILTVISIVACVALLAGMSKQTVRRDASGKTETTGHVWDEDLAEFNNPLPRWWMWLFYITLLFAGGYLLLYPGAGDYSGVLKWTSRAQFDEERALVQAEVAPLYAAFAAQDVKVLAEDPRARAVGERLFLNNCAQCHGSDAGGGKGFPNLRDSDWLYGGEPEAIKASITDGRRGAMPAFGATLKEDDIWNAAHYVMRLSGQLHDSSRAEKGKATFTTICAACHGAEGKGNPAVGAPNLTDGIWLHGGSERTIVETITGGRNSMMPAHRDLLEPEKIHLLTAYVYGLSHRGVGPIPVSAGTKPKN